MFSIIVSGGWLMLPIIVCSVLAMAIICERLWSLQEKRVIPANLTRKIIDSIKEHNFDRQDLIKISKESALGRVLAPALSAMPIDREGMLKILEDSGRHVTHELERNLNLLGIIAAISPLLGLLGTVVGMIKIFTAITLLGVGNANALAGGISEALITTAAGLTVAIPAMIAHRGLVRKIDQLIIKLEREASQFVTRLLVEKKKLTKAEKI